MRFLFRLILVLIIVLLAMPPQNVHAQGTAPTARVICAQYVRQGAYDDAAAIGMIESQPETLRVVAHNDRDRWQLDGIWVLIEQPSTGLRGWMYDGDCLIVRGDLSLVEEIQASANEFAVDSPVANMVCDQFLRAMPNDDSEGLVILQPGEPTLSIIGRDQAAEWLYVQRANGQRGWLVFTDCTSIQGWLRYAPIVRVTYQGAVVATIGCSQVARLEPSNDAVALTTFRPGVGVLAVAGRDVYSNWFLVVAADGRMGWMYNTECLVIHGDIVDAPYPPPSAINGVAFVPSEEITNITEVGAPVTISAIPPIGTYVVEGAAAPSTTLPGGSGLPAPEATAAPAVHAVGGPGETVEVDVNCNTAGGLHIRAGSSITLALRWETTDEALANDWIAAQWSRPLLNGSELPNVNAYLTSRGIQTPAGTWYAGYFYPLGQLAPGVYDVHWDMNLSRAISTGRADYPAGGYAYTCRFSVE